MNTGPNIAKANEILRELDAVYPGGDSVHPLFQLRWSESMVSLVPEYAIVDGEVVPVMEYRCMCGVDRVVHLATCNGITVAKVKVKKVSTFGLQGEFEYISKAWVLCKWNAPPTLDRWVEAMGTDEDYPKNGRYLPVSRGLACIVIPPNAPLSEYPDYARFLVDKMKAWRKESPEINRKLDENALAPAMPVMDGRGNMIRDAAPGKPYHRIVDALKERMRKFNPDGSVGYTGALKEQALKEQIAAVSKEVDRLFKESVSR